MILEVINVKKSFGSKLVLDKLTFGLNKGEVGCLIGPSGCGKTTALRCIAGLENIDFGEIKISGKTVSSNTLNIQPKDRKVGFVFQDYAIVPHMTVKENILFGAKKNDPGKIESICRMLEIHDIIDRYPYEISGGQQQRLAIARALYHDPELVLMDEPFSNLDVNLRAKVSSEVREIIKKYGATALIVTHSREEAFLLADKVGVMNNGKILQWATPYEIYHMPANKFVATFTGEATFLRCTQLNDNTYQTPFGVIKSDFNIKNPVLLIRPEDVLYQPDAPVKATIIGKEFKGPVISYKLKITTGDDLIATFPSHKNFNIGDTISISLELKHTIILDGDL
ncbi:ABC transporter ATP-binding protein [Deferribacter thermophilus]|uniref:ABC transporter ATP-binding protein n=1 Tax=Deferribacter thermophilus TaxID=53573 RepID=UPI003C1CDCD9